MFVSPDSDGDNRGTARHLLRHPPESLQHFSEGAFGYSLYDPIRGKDWYYSIFDHCEAFGCEIEGWHTECGPGVYEAVNIGERCIQRGKGTETR